jgi:RNA polymerase sigma factor (sigma-70 family)
MPPSGVPITDPERAFLEHLHTMERVCACIARRHALSASDAEEFTSWVRLKIIDSDYAVYRKFAGRSSISTYLSVVLGHLFLDYRNSLWGRWRPSAQATRLGTTGIRLEELLNRDGYALREAMEVLRSAGVDLSDVEFARMARSLPRREPSDEVPLEALEGSPQEAVRAPMEARDSDDALAVVRAAIAALADEDQVIVRMRFWDGVSIADIARALHTEQKPLYRRIESIEHKLRNALHASGIDREHARELLSSEVAW